MYITNNIEIAQIAQNAGVDYIFVDLEVLGKQERQGHIDSVKSNHNIKDIAKLRPYITQSKLLVRVNPINDNSQQEIREVIQNGADIVMLPMYKTVNEVKQFVSMVKGQAKIVLLLETKEAHKILEDVLDIEGIDAIHIGLNDLHLSYHKRFMFELLIDGTVEDICKKIKKKGINYGFGGIAAIGAGRLPAEEIICEHYRLQSKMVILSRSFCNVENEKSLLNISRKFYLGVSEIRQYENKLEKYNEKDFKNNFKRLETHIMDIVSTI